MDYERPVLALIPARAGSVSVPGKNIAPCAGRPLAEYTIRAAIGSSAIDRVFVSSDIPDLLALARALSTHPIMRPAHLASAEAGPEGVVTHFLDVLRGEHPALSQTDPLIVYLQPTSPLRTSAHIDTAIAAMRDAACRGVVSVREVDMSPRKMFEADERFRLRALFDEKQSNRRRQDLPRAFMPNGAIYAFVASDFVARGGFPTAGSYAFVMSDEDSVDIDTPEDFARAERLLRERHG